MKKDYKDIFKTEESSLEKEAQLIEEYGDIAFKKIAKIQMNIKRGLSLKEACLNVNVDEKGFQKIIDNDPTVKFLIDSASLEWKMSLYDKVRSSGNSKDQLLLLEKTMGKDDDGKTPLAALVEHIQIEGQGSSLVSDRIKQNKDYGKNNK